MKIGKFTFGMRGHDISQTFDGMCKTANEVDVRNLQFAIAKTMADIDFDIIGYDKELSNAVTEALNKYKLKISVLGCYIDPITEATLESQLTRFQNFIPYAKDFNAVVIGTETGCLNNLQETHSEYGFGRFIKSIERLLPVAEKYNVNIGIEPVWLHTVCSVDRMKQVLDYFKSDNLRVIFDPVNLINDENHMSQKDIIYQAFSCFGDKISTLHLKDYTYSSGVKQLTPVGNGDFNISYCLDMAGQLPVIPDIILDEMPLSNLPGVAERLRNIIL